VNVRNLTPKRKLAWKSPHEQLARALDLPDRSITPDTSHLRIFGCDAYVRIPEEDPEFIKARKTKERARKGAFVGTEGQHGHIFIVWIPEKKRLFRSRDVQFREELKHLPEEVSTEIQEKEEEKTYQVVIKHSDAGRTPEETEQDKPTGMEAKASTRPTYYRYTIPESMAGLENQDPESEPETWYPADIHETILEEESSDLVELDTGTREQETEIPQETEISQEVKRSQDIEKKPKGRQSRKDIQPEEPTRVSGRSTKGQHNDAFAKKHYMTYVSFVAAQLSKQFVPQSLKQALEGPDREMWLAACEKQLEKIHKKGSWELCNLPAGHKAIPTKWVFDPKKRARLVVCGNFEKKADVETFAAVVNMNMVKIFLMVIAAKDWECY
jgi:hypothetical protein